MPRSKALSSNKVSDINPGDIFLFIPNLIGYSRIILALTALCIAFKSYPTMCVCYAMSQILDALDGHVARAFNQATNFGAVLDQVTDRLSTVGTLILNSVVYPQYYWVFALVLICDLGGHWVHTFASIMAGSESHKKIPSAWPVLKLYYESKPLMFVCHASYEIVWVVLFVLSQNPVPFMNAVAKALLIPTSFFCAFKIMTNFMQLIFGAQVLVSIDVEKRSSLRAK